MPTFEFVEVEPGPVELGWRFDDLLTPAVLADIVEYRGEDYCREYFSPHRCVRLPPFEIATTALPWMDLCLPFDLTSAKSLEEACARLNEDLRSHGWRLPTENEFEAAIGGGLFHWGSTIPGGVPWDEENFFARECTTPRGLQLNHDTYRVELVSAAFKAGDGGVSCCGGDPWPLAWLSLATSHRLPREFYEVALAEFLDGALIRPVRC